LIGIRQAFKFNLSLIASEYVYSSVLFGC